MCLFHLLPLAVADMGTGFLITVVDEYIYPLTKVINNLKFLATDTKSFIGITKTVTDNTKSARTFEQTPCKRWQDGRKNQSYLFEQCKNEMVQEKIVELWGCSILTLGPAYGKSNYCTPAKHFDYYKLPGE